MSGRKQFSKSKTLGPPNQNHNRKGKKNNTLEMMTREVDLQRTRSLTYNIEDEEINDNIKSLSVARKNLLTTSFEIAGIIKHKINNNYINYLKNTFENK